MDPAAQRLDLLAATQIIGDAEVAHCWELVRVGIQTHKIGVGNLGQFIAQLRAGSGHGVDEISIDIAEPPSAGRATINVLDDVRTCPAAALIDELELLRVRAAGAPGVAPSSPSPPPSPPPSPATPPGGDDLDLLGVMAGLLGTTPAQLAGDPATYRAHAERVRVATAAFAAAVRDPAATETTRSAAAARLRAVLAESAQAGAATAATRTADVPGTLAALGVDLDRVGAALRTVTEWLEARTPAAGAAVDRLVAALDAAAAPFLGQDTRAQRDAALDTRARDAAREAITTRLRKGGSETT